MNPEIIEGGTALFYKYIIQHQDQVSKHYIDGYYHVDVVAEAYSQGFKDGKESGKKDFLEEMRKNTLEKFFRRATQVYVLTKTVVEFLNRNKYKVDSIYLDVLAQCPRVIISVNDSLLIDDDFVKSSYAKIFEMKRIFSELFDSNLDMGLVSSGNLNDALLKADGFGYSENLAINEHKKTRGKK